MFTLFSNLSNLTNIECSYNLFKSLPSSIGYLNKLISLDCSNNLLTSLPDSIGYLTNLKELYCSDNKLTSLPDSIGEIKKLGVLFCDYNNLTSLPNSIINLREITNMRYDNRVHLTPQQGRYMFWISNDKKCEFDEHWNDAVIKYAGKVEFMVIFCYKIIINYFFIKSSFFISFLYFRRPFIFAT